MFCYYYFIPMMLDIFFFLDLTFLLLKVETRQSTQLCQKTKQACKLKDDNYLIGEEARHLLRHTV